MSLSIPTAEDPTVTVVCDDALARREPLVSVCIITYNQDAFIREAVESVLAQETDFAYEIIIGDDCSTDATRAILEDYQRAHPERIRLHLHEEHYDDGIPAKKNMVTNLEAARGRYVALLDGDDYWISTDKLQRQTAFLERHPGVTLSFHDARTVYEDEEAANRFSETESHLLSERYTACMAESGYFSLDALVNWKRGEDELFVASSSMMYHRSAFDPVPDWFWKVWNADRAMQLHLAEQGAVYYHHDLVGCRRKSAGSMTVHFANTLERNHRRIEQNSFLRQVSPAYHHHGNFRLYKLYRWQGSYWWNKRRFLRMVYALSQSASYGALFWIRQTARSLRTLL